SFPDRTRMTFSPGVSVIVGPNGSGKSNITDAVLWALGEQSPSAIRGHQMRDVIFAGGSGQSARRFAEVEVVIDNTEGRAASEFSEISISRRIDRNGDNPERANDVEREARSHLRPLKRQAEAAERTAKITRESNELRARI